MADSITLSSTALCRRSAAVATPTSLYFYREEDHYKMPRLTAARAQASRQHVETAHRFNRVVDDSSERLALYRRALSGSE
jgi:hypothetical protein